MKFRVITNNLTTTKQHKIGDIIEMPESFLINFGHCVEIYEEPKAPKRKNTKKVNGSK